MSWAQDISAAAAFFAKAAPRTVDGKDIKADFQKWYKSLTWFEKFWPSKKHFSVATYNVVSYNDVEYPKAPRSQYGLRL